METRANNTRSTPRRRMPDPRLLTGIVLVAASVAGVVAVVGAADRTVTVYSAGSTLTVGSTVTSDDLVATEVRMDAASRYLDPTAFPKDGVTMVRTVGAGELVPLSAVGERLHDRQATVVVAIAGALPRSLSEGAEVDLWAATGDEEEPRIVAADATIVALSSDDAMIGAARTVSVELLVDRDRIPAVLAATAAGERFSLVPTSVAMGG